MRKSHGSLRSPRRSAPLGCRVVRQLVLEVTLDLDMVELGTVAVTLDELLLGHGSPFPLENPMCTRCPSVPEGTVVTRRVLKAPS